MMAHSAVRLTESGQSQRHDLGAAMSSARTSARTDDIADALRAVAVKLQSIADLLDEPSEPAAGQSLGADDELTPAQTARLEAAVVRHRRRAKQAYQTPPTRPRSAQQKETGKPGHTAK